MTAPMLHTIALHPGTNALRKGPPKADALYDRGVLLGQQPGDTWLYLLDLDSHTAGQNADAALAHVQRSIRSALFGRLALHRSRSGKGWHILVRLAFDLGTGASTKLRIGGVHVGELIGPGQHTWLPDDAAWHQRDSTSIPALCADEWHQLAAVFDPIRTTASATTARKDRIAEGQRLIAGWERIADWHEYRDALLEPQNKLADKLRQSLLELRRPAPDLNRSDAYGRLVQRLMLSACWLPHVPTADRYRYVAAIAIHTGAAGKEGGKGGQSYNIANDTAALIAKIKHGDAFDSGSGTWVAPFWCDAAHLGVQAHQRPAVAVAATPAPRQPGRPAGSRARRLKRLYAVLEAITPDAFGRRVYFVADLAERLSTSTATVKPRTVQSYLQTLEQAACIARGQIGNGAAYCILKCVFEGADNAKKPCTNDAKQAANQGADASAANSIATPQTAVDGAVAIEEEGTPIISAPCLAAPDAPSGAYLLGVPPSSPLIESATPTAPSIAYTSHGPGYSTGEGVCADGSTVWLVWDDSTDAIIARFATEHDAVQHAQALLCPSVLVEPDHNLALCARYDPASALLPEPAPRRAPPVVTADQHMLDGSTVAALLPEPAPDADPRSGARQKAINQAVRGKNKGWYSTQMRLIATRYGEDFYALTARHPYLGPKPKNGTQQRMKLTLTI